MPVSDYPLFESIKINNNQIFNLEYHKERIADSSKKLFGKIAHIDFKSITDEIKLLPPILFKLRLVYNADFFKYAFIPYKLPTTKSLKLVRSDKVSYNLKLSDRENLTNLYKRRQHYDDIIIVKNGFITDSYNCNIALMKSGIWYTPNTPLLAGTKRNALIEQNKLIENEIHSDSLREYDYLSLINAMIDLDVITLPISSIY